VRLITPELLLTLAACFVLGISALPEAGRRLWAPLLAGLTCLMTLLSVLSFVWKFGFEALRAPDVTIGFSGLFILDAFSVFFKVVFLLAAILTILVSSRYLDVERANMGEFYALILFAVLGMMFLASAGDFITIFVSIETMALSFYILVTVGLGFKIAAVPFHMWAPDAYEGAPTPVTAFLSTGSKAAAFVALARIFSMGFLPLGPRWATLLAILSVASMTLGNVAAI